MSKNQESDGYSFFVERAKKGKASEDENFRLGFESKHRSFDESLLVQHIRNTLSDISDLAPNDLVIDIGAGGGRLAQALEQSFKSENVNYLMVDSKEILDLGFKPAIAPVYGLFPNNYGDLRKKINELGMPVKQIIANSILHYVRYDNLLENFIFAICNLLAPGGTAFLGDVPSSDLKMAQAKIDDREFVNSAHNFSYGDISSIAVICRYQGCSVYVIPQPREFPMSPHRFDLIILKHKVSTPWE